jgi:hypothetical protein
MPNGYFMTIIFCKDMEFSWIAQILGDLFGQFKRND